MPTRRREDNHLHPLEKKIVLHLATNQPQTINEINKGTHLQPRTSYMASVNTIKNLEKQKLIRKTGIKNYRNRKFPLYWLSQWGALTALIEGADPKDLLKRTVEMYPNDKTLQLLLEMSPFTGTEVYKTAFSAIISKGKLEQSDAVLIMLTMIQKNLPAEQQDQFLKVLSKYHDEYEKATNQIKQIANFLERKEK